VGKASIMLELQIQLMHTISKHGIRFASNTLTRPLFSKHILHTKMSMEIAVAPSTKAIMDELRKTEID